MSLSVSIRFHLLQSFHLPHRRQLKELLQSLMDQEKTVFESLDYIFCDDEYLLRINRDFLDHDYFTDIISFNLGQEGGPVIGEIYISIDRVKENAREFSQSFLRELQRVMVHGALHLAGYGDSSPSEIKTMRIKENYYLALLSARNQK